MEGHRNQGPEKAAGRGQETRQITTREFYMVIFVHKWTIFAAFIVLLVAILWGLSLRERLFVSSAKFYVNRALQQQSSLRFISNLTWEEQINSIAEIGRSQGVLVRASRAFDQVRGWENPPESRVQEIAAGLSTMIEVLPVPETDIINILVRDEDADTSLLIADIYGQGFVREFQRVSQQSHSRTFYQNAIRDVEDKIKEAKAAKSDLQEEARLFNWQHEEMSLTESIHILTRELTKKRVNREILEKELEFEKACAVSESDFIYTSSLREDDLVNQLEFRMNELRMELAELESRYTADHRLVMAKQSEIEAAREHRNEILARKVREHEQQVEELRSGELVIVDTITEMEERLDEIPAGAVQLAYYDAYIQSQWRLYSELITKYNDTRASDEQSLIENQLVSLGPPNIGGIEGETTKVVYWVVAPIFAFLLAVSVAFMAEATNHSFQKTAELEEFSGLPVLATFRKI